MVYTLEKALNKGRFMATPRDNLLRTMRRQGFETVPLDISLCPAQVEAFKKRFGHADYISWFKVPFRHAGVPMQAGYKDGRALFRRETLPENAQIDVFGVGHSAQPGCYHMTHMHHPLAGDPSLQEVLDYPLPELAPDADIQLKEHTGEVHAQGLAVMGGMACTIWEIAWYIRSMEDLMMDMMTDDERAAPHLDKIMRNGIERVKAYARAGVDIIQLGDDIGMQKSIMMSMALWRKWIKPRTAAIIRAGREIKPDLLFFYHSCGYIIPFIEELIEIGIDILNPVQPECMDFDEVHKLVRGRASFWGGIGTQSTLPFGSPDDVREAVRARLERCGKAGGIVIAPTHLVEPEVPWENLRAMAEAAWEFRA